MIIHQPHHRAQPFNLRRFMGFGPDRLATDLAHVLDDDFHYLPRVVVGSVSRGAAPIDAVIVGSGGIWAITTAHDTGRCMKRNGHWYRWNRSTESWVPWDAQPIMDTRLAAHRLEAYLDRAALASTVEPVLLCASRADIGWSEGERPGVHVHTAAAQLATRIARDDVLSPPQVDRIVALLDPRQPLPRLATSIQG